MSHRDADIAASAYGRIPMSDIRRNLKGLCDAFNAHDLDRIMDHFADDCVLEMPRGSQPWGARSEGKEAVRKALAGRFEGLPDVHYGNEQHFVDEGANTGMSKWTLTGTRRDGQRIEVHGCDFYTFRDGKVTRKDSYWKIVE
jgi:steroid delta-isomerase-like uncharacterized protein